MISKVNTQMIAVNVLKAIISIINGDSNNNNNERPRIFLILIWVTRWNLVHSRLLSYAVFCYSRLIQPILIDLAYYYIGFHISANNVLNSIVDPDCPACLHYIHATFTEKWECPMCWPKNSQFKKMVIFDAYILRFRVTDTSLK